jgi:hypothetical protein
MELTTLSDISISQLILTLRIARLPPNLTYINCSFLVQGDIGMILCKSALYMEVTLKEENAFLSI